MYFHVQVVFTLETYGVKNIVGIPFGFRGFFEKGLKEMPVRSSSHKSAKQLLLIRFSDFILVTPSSFHVI